MFTDDIIYCSG